MLAYIGFFNFKLTPYIAGSVIPPRNAVILEDIAKAFKFLFLVFKETAKEAAA